ncbi:MAG TPA: CHAT domain-containing protein [Ornithinibacter sp.]|nr:CHAT domain-containing protein [Ornithinibacter sp.]
MPATYLDFDLLIEPGAQGYRAKVLDSPAGEAAADFSLPFTPQDMDIFLLRLTRSLSEARRRVRRLESQERELVRGFGGQLFQAMFSGPVLGALQSSLNEAFRKDAGLRIRLRLADTPELADVPWEFLFNPVANRFLNLAPDTPLIRYLDLPMPVRPLTVTPPLRVLVMVSSPTDFPELDVAAEVDRLTRALDEVVKRGLVTITRLPSASLSGLQRPLRLENYHIFHFIGHGGFDDHAQDGALALEDAYGRSRLVSGQDLGVMLSAHRSLRLIVLNACEGARAATSDPFAGVAQSLVQQGIPAVIAMQFEITDEAAITFSEELYAAIADGYSVDAALGEARRAIFASGNDVEWATPVLYTRSANGQLFRLSKLSEAARLAREQAERDEAARLAAEQTQRKETARLAREQADRDEAARLAREQAELDEAAREAAEQTQREEAARLAAKRTQRDEAARRDHETGDREQDNRDPAAMEGAEQAQSQSVGVGPGDRGFATALGGPDAAGGVVTRENPEGPSWPRRHVRLTLAAVLLAVIASGVIIAVQVAGGGQDPTSGSGPTSSSGPTSDSGPTTGPDPDYEELLTRLPASIRGNCRDGRSEEGQNWMITDNDALAQGTCMEDPYYLTYGLWSSPSGAQDFVKGNPGSEVVPCTADTVNAMKTTLPGTTAVCGDNTGDTNPGIVMAWAAEGSPVAAFFWQGTHDQGEALSSWRTVVRAQ